MKIILYDYRNGRWVKVQERVEPIKLKVLVQPENKVPIYKGRNFSEIIVTDFNSATPLQSMYYVESTLSQNSIVADIISRSEIIRLILISLKSWIEKNDWYYKLVMNGKYRY